MRTRPLRQPRGALILAPMATRRPLIGRDEERARLERALARALDGDGTFVLVSGDAGIGKTRLVDEAAGASGARALRAAAMATRVEPHAPLVAALRCYLRVA